MCSGEFFLKHALVLLGQMLPLSTPTKQAQFINFPTKLNKIKADRF